MAPDAEDRIIQAVNEIVGGSERRLTESIGSVRVQLVRLVGRVDAQEQKCVLQHKHMDDKFGGLQTVVDNIQDKQEVTGNHEIALLQKKADEAEAGKHAIVKEQKEAVQHWHRYVLGGIGALVFAIVSQYILMRFGLK